MAASGYTAISLYYSTTASATPSAGNLVSGELALNIADGKLFYKDGGGTVQTLAGKGGTGVVAGSNTQIQFNNSGVFGASSSLTWDGTTFAASNISTAGSLTLSGGTANGVAYLNGSKVVTSGSALTFDGTNLNVGNGTNTYTAKLLTNGLAMATDNTTYQYMGLCSSGVAYAGTATNHPYAFAINGSEQMRLTSTGLGIGTSSPAVKLDVAGNATIQNGVLTIGKDTVYDAFINTPESMYFNVDSDGNSTGNRFVWGTDRTGTSGGTEWMRLDSSGNLGLGVTPSAWISAYKALDIGTMTSLYGRTDTTAEFALSLNGYRASSGSWLYKTNNAASRYGQAYGSHVWSTAASGNAGDPITFTDAMTLDSSGNLGIGTSLPGAKLEVYAGDLLVNRASGNAALGIKTTGGSGRTYYLVSDVGGSFQIYDNNASANRATLDSSGNLGLGVTPSAWNTSTAVTALQLPNGSLMTYSNAYGFSNLYLSANAYLNNSGWVYTKTNSASLYEQVNGQHAWKYAPSGTAGNAITFTQAMTLDASGNLGVGTTSPTVVSNYKSVTVNGTTGGLVDIASNGTVGLRLQCDTTYPGGAFFTLTNQPMIFGTNGTERARIDSSGNLLVGINSGSNKFIVKGGNGDSMAVDNDGSQYTEIDFRNNGTYKTGLYWDNTNARFYVQAVSAGVYLASGGTSWTSASDERVKDIIEPIENATQKLAGWRTVIGKYKDDEEGTRRSFLIAQDVLASFPEAVDSTNENELGVRYQDTIPMLVKAIQELKSELDSVKAELATLKGV